MNPKGLFRCLPAGHSGVRRQSEAATALSVAGDIQERQTLLERKRCRASLATALQSGLSLALALVAVCAAAATPPGLVGWWRAEGNANDSAGANPGIPEGGLAYVPGEVGLAFTFNGTDADVRIPASDALNVGAGSGMSVEAWIKPADVAARHPFFEWNDGAFGTTMGFSGSLPEGGAGPGAFVANFNGSSSCHYS
ncbi:MAG TPA: hypothetical protein VN829_23235 [Dongiaceae bacterium]|nr:hypothetical protein [Dongiaceae bacterium]